MWIRATRAASSRQLTLALFCLAFLVRVAHLVQVGPTPILNYHRNLPDSDMYLFDQWARRIAAGDVLGREIYHPVAQWQLRAAPLADWTRWYEDAPVYYKAPFYAYLIAGLYRVFGDSIVPLALLQILVSCCCSVLVLQIGERLFGHAAGLMGGLVYALYAPEVHYDVIMLRGPWISLVALVGTLQLMNLLRAPTYVRALTAGLTLGAGLIVNEGFLTVPPLAVALLAWRLPATPQVKARAATMMLLGIALSLSPIMIRNVLVGVSPLKLATTGSTVYAVFNSAGSSPYFFDANPVAFVPTMRAGDGHLLATALACFNSFGGPAEVLAFYLRKATGLVIPFENPDNANFYYAVLKSPLLLLLPNYTFLFPTSVIGIALALRRWRDLLPLMPFWVSLLISVMVALPLSRYRATLAACFAPFAGLALIRLVSWVKDRRIVPLAVATSGFVLLLIVAGVLQTRFVFAGRPAGIFLYRPLEFLLGADHYSRWGRHTESIQELQLLLKLNPAQFFRPGVMLTIAGLQLASGNESAARDTLKALVQLNPADPVLLMSVGDFHRDALKDADGARSHYERALALQPDESFAAALRERLSSLGPR